MPRISCSAAGRLSVPGQEILRHANPVGAPLERRSGKPEFLIGYDHSANGFG